VGSKFSVISLSTVSIATSSSAIGSSKGNKN
jgi:hypothetical protein